MNMLCLMQTVWIVPEHIGAWTERVYMLHPSSDRTESVYLKGRPSVYMLRPISNRILICTHSICKIMPKTFIDVSGGYKNMHNTPFTVL